MKSTKWVRIFMAMSLVAVVMFTITMVISLSGGNYFLGLTNAVIAVMNVGTFTLQMRELRYIKAFNNIKRFEQILKQQNKDK